MAEQCSDYDSTGFELEGHEKARSLLSANLCINSAMVPGVLHMLCQNASM